MGREKPTTKIVAIAGFIGGIASIAAWFGVTPDMLGETLYGFVHPTLPMVTFTFGCIAGWCTRDYMKSRDAETAARIEMEKAEHAEKMRREREERETAMRIARAEETEKEEYAERLERAASQFKTFEIDAKAVACMAYDEGEIVLNFDVSNSHDAASYEVKNIMEAETLPEGQYRYTLKPFTRDMLDAYPELLDDVRAYMEQKRASNDMKGD